MQTHDRVADAGSTGVVELAAVEKSFELGGEAVPVLRGVDLSLGDETASIVGPSGSGKSTLLHIMGTLDEPTAGTVRIADTDPAGLSEPELAAFRNRTIGFVFQEHYLLPQYDVLENVLLPALAYGDAAEARERAVTLVERVGLSHRLHHRPAELSGGERQRAAVARALVNEPRLLLCDEPTGSLDRTNAAAVADLLLELTEQRRGSLVVVTHSTELAARFARRFEIVEGSCSER